jgi:hypothetical protein
LPTSKKEVRGSLVVPVAEELGERELQDALVKLDRLLDVGADQRGVVNAAGGGRRPAGRDVRGLKAGAVGLDRVQVDLCH